MTERPTIPILAERIETLARQEATHHDESNAKFARVYALLGAILVSVIAGVVVQLVIR